MESLRKRLKNGELLVGTMISEVRNPNIAYMPAQCGYDFFIIDNDVPPLYLPFISLSWPREKNELYVTFIGKYGRFVKIIRTLGTLSPLGSLIPLIR